MKSILFTLVFLASLYAEPKRIFGWELAVPWSGPAAFLSNQGIAVRDVTEPGAPLEGYIIKGTIIAAPLVQTTAVQVFQGKICGVEFSLNDPTEDTFDTVVETLTNQFPEVRRQEYIYASKDLIVSGTMNGRDTMVSIRWSRFDKTIVLRYLDVALSKLAQIEVKKARQAKTQGM